ncbi:MAG: hypothetical protein FJ255_06835 [Phycisphaerae bacterium]|nr:hypothetical protein [Phycisphaerae bacterium]
MLAPVALAAMAAAASFPPGPTIVHELTPTSRYTLHMCLPPCACPTYSLNGPIAGAMRLRLVEQTPISSRYQVAAVHWRATVQTGPIDMTGDGEYLIRYVGPAVFDQMTLDLTIQDLPWTVTGGPSSGIGEPPLALTALAMESPVAYCRQHVFSIGTRGHYLADLNADGTIDFGDFLEFLNLYNAGDRRADFNLDGAIDFNDLLEMLNEMNAGP